MPETDEMTTVSVSIVLHDSANDVGSCLLALDRQVRAPDEVVVLDNASTDGGLETAVRTLPGIRAIRSERNLGFAAGQNRAMDAAPADVHVALNPDCRLAPTFLERAVTTLQNHPAAGSLSGRLLRFHQRWDDSDQPIHEQPDDILDSTGMLALRNRRVLDRGSELPANGRYHDLEEVFGASGAAAVYRRAMLEDIAVDGQAFDEAFHAYREDVDLAWRAQLRSWPCLYEPGALARHRRRVAPGRRRSLPAAINRRSIANRWRMIAKNETRVGWTSDWPAITARDIATVAYCVLREQGSLAAVKDVIADRRQLRDWRRHVMARRSADDREVLEWFGRRESIAIPQTRARAIAGETDIPPN